MGKRIIFYIKYIFECLESIIYYNDLKCVLCGKELFEDEEKYLCDKCGKNIILCKNKYYVERKNMRIKFYSAAYYSRSVKEMIIKLKYKKDFLCGEALSDLMCNFIRQNDLKFDEITFVPMRKEEIKKRGYNQSEFLARRISKISKIPIKNYLFKKANTRDQIGLSGEMRWNNLENAFGVFDDNSIMNKRILLVDDVFTTGATGFYCARNMIFNGAKDVMVLTAAKSSI